MIRLFRPPEPAGLSANKWTWTQRWKGQLSSSSGNWATAAASALLRTELFTMSFGKCVYCEGLLEAQSSAEIEHYIAKTIGPDLVFEWSNLFLACRKCNGSKRDVDHKGHLLKPDVDDGEEHLWLNPANGELQPLPGLPPEGQLRAEETIRICDLNRGPLCRQRFLLLRAVQRWIERIHAETSPAKQQELDEWLAPSATYKLAIRFGFTHAGFKALAVEDRSRFETASR